MIDIGIHKIFDPLCEKYYIKHEKYQDKEFRMKRCYTLVKWGYSMFYYLFSSSIGLYLVMETKLLPTWMDSDSDCFNTYKDYPQISESYDLLNYYYLMQLGKHFARAFLHMFVRPEGNYYEYALHHMLSLSLIIFSYLMNFWLVGILVLFLHDISDFFLILIRSYMVCFF